jgi:hypothetical protein
MGGSKYAGLSQSTLTGEAGFGILFQRSSVQIEYAE